MRVEEVEFLKSGGVERFTLLLAAPTNNPTWLLNAIAKKYKAKQLTLQPKSTEVPRTDENEFVIVSGVELPVLAEYIDADSMYSAIQTLRAQCNNVCVCITISPSLVNSESSNGRALNRLVKKLLYDAQLVLQLQPLPSGRARDLTGTFVIAAGPRHEKAVWARELSYFVDPKGLVNVLEM